MREDMMHVLTEKALVAADCASHSLPVMQHRQKNRYRAAKVFRLDAQGDVCDLYSSGKLPMRHPQQGYDCKRISVRYAVLDRYLERHIGEPWDRLYAEIHQVIRRKSWLERWLLLDWLICPPHEAIAVRPGQLFVDAQTGLLQRLLP